MSNACRAYKCPYCVDTPMYNPDFSNQYSPFADEMKYGSRFDFSQSEEDDGLIEMKDYGPEPYIVNINEATKQNDTYRTALWTGRHLQLTLMSLNVGEDIGLEIHPDVDQFIRIEEGEGLAKMGDRKDKLDFQERVYDDFAFIVPAGKWHNLRKRITANNIKWVITFKILIYFRKFCCTKYPYSVKLHYKDIFSLSTIYI